MRNTRNRFPPGLNGVLAFIHPVGASAAGQEAPQAPEATETPEATQAPEVTQASVRKTRAEHDHRDMIQWLALGASLLALAVGLLDFTLLIGALPMPVPGLQAAGQPVPKDTATYAFEFDNDGWLARGAATSAISNNTRVFDGQGALEFQVTGVSAQQQAFVYTTLLPAAKPGTKVIAHVYAPTGAPPLLATIYILDASYAWHSGPYLGLTDANWTALAFQIPTQAQAPIRQLGVLILGTTQSQPYTGPLYLDSVDLQNP